MCTVKSSRAAVLLGLLALLLTTAPAVPSVASGPAPAAGTATVRTAAPVPGATAKRKVVTPPQVKGVVIDAATRTSLALNFPGVRAAKRYEVWQADNYNMRGSRMVRKVAAPGRVWVTGLTSGRRYCFQVRGVSKKQVVRVVKIRRKNGTVKKKKIKRVIYGQRSMRVCKAPIPVEGSGGGPRYKVATYNVCVGPCENRRGSKPGVPWSTRRPWAARFVQDLAPDVLGLQEAGGRTEIPGAFGMREAYEIRGKSLLYNDNRFSLATDQSGARTGAIDLGTDSQVRHAVWAELVDHTNADRSVIFVSAHFAPSTDNQAASDRARAANTRALLNGVAAVNTGGRPVVVVGDFNSHPGRTYDSPSKLFGAAGFHDSYEVARSLVKPHHNSGNQFQPVPIVGAAQGYHMDRIWVSGRSTRVLQWRNGAQFANGRYSPLPSDHSPIMATIALNP